jgi:hypothetical protein
MTAPRDPDPILSAWLDEGPTRLPESTRRAILVSARTSQQRRHRMWVPWRTSMNPIARFAIAAIAVVAVVGIVGVNLFGASPGTGTGTGVGSLPSPTPSPAVATPAVSATPTPQPSPSPIDTATWTTYVSARYGFSIGHPSDWTQRPSDRVWTLAADADWLTTASEGFIAPGSSILATAWSVAVQPGTSAEAWLRAYCLIVDSSSPCATIQDRAIAVTVDGHAASLVPFNEDTQAFILFEHRMYVVAVWEPDSDPRTAPYGGAIKLLEAYLSTMHLLPGGPAHAPATPRPS